MSSDVPQFSTAEYSNKAGETACKACGQKISGPQYRVNGVPACASCTQRLRDQLPQDSHQAFVRAILFGIGGAILGFAIYVGIRPGHRLDGRLHLARRRLPRRQGDGRWARAASAAAATSWRPSS